MKSRHRWLRNCGLQTTVSHNLAASQPNVVTQAMEPIEAMPATPETMRYPGYGEPFHDFTQLPVEGPGCSGCGGECDGSCAAGSCGCGPEILPGMAVDHLSFFGGVHGFKNGGNRGQDGSFGFQEGFNFGTSARNVIFPPTVGLQFGLQATQSNLDGAAFTTADRNQIFMTVGGFRRADCGLQGGLVFDYLWDDWYYDLSVGQVRGEASVAISSGSSYGLWFTAPVQDDIVASQVNGATLTESWETMDIYALFFRSNLLAGGTGEGRLYAGMTGGSDGIVGAESRLPLMNGWALETEFAYLIPNEPTGDGANETEAWNLGINLVWYPGSLACGQCIRYHRPMFDVANNGSLILRAK